MSPAHDPYTVGFFHAAACSIHTDVLMIVDQLKKTFHQDMAILDTKSRALVLL